MDNLNIAGIHLSYPSRTRIRKIHNKVGVIIVLSFLNSTVAIGCANGSKVTIILVFQVLFSLLLSHSEVPHEELHAQ